jgi:OFA family oxalate/formate antiporter-like MFS transporter
VISGLEEERNVSQTWPRHRHHEPNRWLQLVGGVVAMMAIATVLYVWPLLRSAPGRDLAESLATTENAFAAFILAETFFVPVEGWLRDRVGRWPLVAAGLALVALGAIAGAHTESKARVLWYALGGVGAGAVYGGTIAKVLKRFTDRKLLCVGVTAAACAAVSALGLGALGVALASPGAVAVLIVLGAAQAAVIVVATLFILSPPPADRLPPE